MKTCTTCKLEKQPPEFSKSAQSKDGLQGRCKACQAAYAAANREKAAAYQAAHRAANREKLAAQKAAYYAANRAKLAARHAAYRTANPEAIKAQKAEYRAANKGAIKACYAAHYAANREKIAVRHADYRAANPEKRAALDRNRRARVRSAEGKHTAADVRAIFTAQRGLCANCETKLFKSGKQIMHIDHIMPLALGGSNWPSNLQCLCPACNLSKSAKHPAEWAKQQGRLI